MEQPKKFSDTFETEDLYVNFLGLLKIERKRTISNTSLDEPTPQLPSTNSSFSKDEKPIQKKSRGVLKLIILVVLFLLCFPVIVRAVDVYAILFLVPLALQLGITISNSHLLLVIELVISMLIAQIWQ
jgi:hypothetical protein